MDFTFYDEEAKTAKETQLNAYLNTAINAIIIEGATLDLSEISDCMLVAMYAEWLYDKRKDPTAQMPRMVRWNLNNKIFSQKIGDDE